MKRCRAEGRERFELWVGAAVLANNLMKIAGLRNKRTRGKLKPPDTSGGEISRK
jgi:transposase, IS5 family